MRTMKLDLVVIPVTPREIVVSDFSWLPDGEGAGISDPKALLSVVKEGDDKFVVKGRLQFFAELPCDRCGEQFGTTVDSEFTYFFKHGVDAHFQEEEVELSEKDIDTVYLEESFIDLHDILLEQYYLNIPESRLCRDDCQGLCHRCGEPQSEKGCSCEPDFSNSPFAALAKLKKES